MENRSLLNDNISLSYCIINAMPETLVLFSQPSPEILERIKPFVFPEFLKEKIFAYMPSDGGDQEGNSKFSPIWREYAKNNGAKFVEIDNSKRGEEAKVEQEKLLASTILMITGGNTFKLLNHLRQSGLDQAVIQFWKKGGVVLAGFSAGAIVLGPSIKTAKTGNPSEVGLTDLSGLGIVNFQVWPHYEPSQDEEISRYKSTTKDDLKPIANDGFIVINK